MTLYYSQLEYFYEFSKKKKMFFIYLPENLPTIYYYIIA